MNYVVDKVKEEQKEDVSILTHPPSCIALSFRDSFTVTLRYWYSVDNPVTLLPLHRLPERHQPPSCPQ